MGENQLLGVWQPVVGGGNLFEALTLKTNLFIFILKYKITISQYNYLKNNNIYEYFP